MAEQFKFEGGRELEAALLDLPTATSKRVGRFALRKAGQPILDDYKAGTTVASGHLEESETMGTRLNPSQRSRTPRPGPSEVVIHIGTADPAGIMEEFGLNQAANPALTRAWDRAGGQKAVDTIARELKAALDRALRRIKKG